MTDREFVRCVKGGTVMGVICGALLVGYIFATGQTFGQRCHKMHPHGDDATISACVFQLSHQR